jgi:sulfate adenylyltransferase subunit 1 (EFTu-like GTPase family)
MPWYVGPPVLNFLEELHIANDRNLHDARFPVQYVIRPQTDEYHDFRGFGGQIASGAFRVGDPILVLPSGLKSRVKSIWTYDGELETAFTPMSVTLTLEDEIDISRGDMLVKPDNLPYVEQTFDAMVTWMNDVPLRLNGKYAIKHCSRAGRVLVKGLPFRVDIQTLERDYNASELRLNEIGRVTFMSTGRLAFDAYSRNRQTGSFIIVEEGTNLTVGAGLICEPIKELHLEEPIGANL